MEQILHGIPLTLLLDALAEPVKVTDAAGVVVFTNPAGAERFGWDKLIGLPLRERLARLRLFRPDSSPLKEAEYPVSRVLATGEPVVGANLLVETGGRERRSYVMNTVPLREGSRLLGTVSVLHDVTEPVRLRNELADHAARLEAIVNLVSEGVFVVGRDGTLLFANAVGERLLGLRAGVPLAERACRLDLREADGTPVPAERFPSSRALRGETLAGVTFELAGPEGGRRRVLAGAHPLRRGEGDVYAALVTMKDVTDEVQAREDLEAARARAEEASQLKDQFIAALSHELRAPLQPSDRPRDGGDPPQHPPAGPPGGRPAGPVADRPPQARPPVRDLRPPRAGAGGRGALRGDRRAQAPALRAGAPPGARLHVG